jgi:ATP-dependent protease ClpP protease subunit
MANVAGKNTGDGMSARETFKLRIAARARLDLMLVQDAQKRGHFTDGELSTLRTDATSTLPSCLEAYRAASEAEGKRVPTREYLTPKPAEFGGVFVAHGDTPQILLYGEIGAGPGIVSAHNFIHALAVLDGQDIDLRIHCCGGNYVQALEIADAVSKRRGKTRGIVDGLAASGGSIVLMRCNPIGIARGGRIIVHFARGSLSEGATANQLERYAAEVRDVDKQIGAEYLDRWTGTVRELVAAMNTKTSFVDDDAVGVGLADFVMTSASIATQAEIEAVADRQNVNPFLCADRTNFRKYETIFRNWTIAARYMEGE